MTASKAILSIVPTMQSIAIASSAYKAIPKKNKKVTMKKTIRSTTDVIVGTSLMQASAGFLSGVD